MVKWVASTWEQEVWEPAHRHADPVAILVALARGHVVYCRRDVARVIMALRVEFAGREHPVGETIERIVYGNALRFAALITAGREAGSIPPGPPAEMTAIAGIGAIEGLAIQIAGRPPMTNCSPSASCSGCSAGPVVAGRPGLRTRLRRPSPPACGPRHR